MEIYKQLAEIGCFTKSDLVRITGSEHNADWHMRSLLQKGYIKRVRRDLYVVISLETNQPIPSRFQIASSVASDAFVSHHSAFELHGYANQVFYELYLSSKKRVRPFDFDGVEYTPVNYRGDISLTETANGIRVSSIERTVIDSIADFEKIAGLEEVLRCLQLVPSLDESLLLDVLSFYSQRQLYQKVGYILESLQGELFLSEEFFDKCEQEISNSKTYLFRKQDDFVFHKRWLLYAPENLKSMINKGFDVDVAI